MPYKDKEKAKLCHNKTLLKYGDKYRKLYKSRYFERYARKYKESHGRAYKKWVLKNRIKLRAEAKLRYAVKKGRLIKSPCKICGNLRSVAHHPDYSKPLEVIWLCHQHHYDWHHDKISTIL